MGNTLNQDLTGKTVVFRDGVLKAEFAGMAFRVTGGFGASPQTMGRALFGLFEDGEEARFSGYDVARIADHDAERERRFDLFEQATKEIDAALEPGQAFSLSEIEQRIRTRWRQLLDTCEHGVAITSDCTECEPPLA